MFDIRVGIGTTTPDASSALDISSTTKGFLMPRMTTAERTAIATPANGLQVYDTDTKSQWFYNGTVWLESGTATLTSKWTNDATNTRVVLTNLSDGSTARPLGTEYIIKDNGNITSNQGIVNLTATNYLNPVGFSSTSYWITNPPLVPNLKLSSSDNLALAPVFVGTNLLPFEYNISEVKQNHLSGYVGVTESGNSLPSYVSQYNQIALGADVTSSVREVTASLNRVSSNPLSSGAINSLKGIESLAFHYGSGSLTSMRGSLSRSNVWNGTASSVFGSYSEANVKNTGSATTMYSNYNSLDFDNVSGVATTLGTIYSRGVLRNGKVTNLYGIQNSLALVSTNTGTAIGNVMLHDNVLDYGTSLSTANLFGGRYVINLTSSATGGITSLYGNRITMTNSSSTSTITNAYGLFIDAIPTSTNHNYGVYVNGNKNYFSGNVGIGVINPGSKLQVETTDERFATFGTSAFQNQYFTIRNEQGVEFGMSTNSAYGASGAVLLKGGAGKTIAFKANEVIATNFPGTNTADLFIDLSGNIGIGSLTPTEKLQVNGAIKIGTTTTATPTAGTIRFNSTTSKFEGYDGTAWVAFH